MCLITRPDKRPLLLETSSGRPFVLASSKFRTRLTKELWVPSFYMIWHPPLWDSFICHDTQKRGYNVIFKICQKERIPFVMERVGATALLPFYENLFFLREVWRTNYLGNIQQLSGGEPPPPPLLSPRALFFPKIDELGGCASTCIIYTCFQTMQLPFKLQHFPSGIFSGSDIAICITEQVDPKWYWHSK